MSKFDDAVEKALESAKKAGVKVDNTLLTAVAKGLGPSIYNTDSMYVAMSNKVEVETLHKNFVVKKLGVKDEAKAKAAIESVKSTLSGINKKLRILVCTLLVMELKKQSVYK